MRAEIKIGDIVEAEVVKITDFGAFVKTIGQTSGLIHISQISNSFVKDIKQHLKVGDKVRARVVKFRPGKKMELSLKQAQDIKERRQKKGSGFRSSDFEEKLKVFLKKSRGGAVW